MKDKKYKYFEDVAEDYIDITEQLIELDLQAQKSKTKYEAFTSEHGGGTLNQENVEDGFKIFTQQKKYEERKEELQQELTEIERLLREFLNFLKEPKISYEKKDDNKNKLTFLFWLEEGELKCNR